MFGVMSIKKGMSRFVAADYIQLCAKENRCHLKTFSYFYIPNFEGNKLYIAYLIHFRWRIISLSSRNWTFLIWNQYRPNGKLCNLTHIAYPAGAPAQSGPEIRYHINTFPAFGHRPNKESPRYYKMYSIFLPIYTVAMVAEAVCKYCCSFWLRYESSFIFVFSFNRITN
jgi:hypothetical protein